MKARIYIEGGGDSKELRARCREGFRRLFEKCGFSGRMPHLVACGGRDATFDDFCIAHLNSKAGDYVALLVDSEEPVADIEEAWFHLKARDKWDKPSGAEDKQVLLMTTCMEAWIVSDRHALRIHYPGCLQEAKLPALNDMESRTRAAVLDSLVGATHACKNCFIKGKRSFELVGRLDPAELRKRLPSFARCERVLRENLQ